MGFIKDTGNVLKRELGRIKRYPLYLTLMVILPVASFGIFALMFSDGVPRDIPIAVVDEDKTPTSRTLITMIDATPSALVAYHAPSLEEAEAMVKRGDIMGMVYIPPHFEKDILSNKQTSVAAYLSALNITANGLVGKDVQTAVSTYSSGIQMQLLMKTGMSEKQAKAQMMPVYFDKHVLFNPYINYTYYLLPSFMPMMLMVFSLILSVFSIGTELRGSTAGEWFAVAGGKTAPALIGKILPYTLSMFLMVLCMNSIMYKWIGVPLNGSYTVLLLGAFEFILAYQALGIFIITMMSNLRMALSVGGGYTVLAFTFSGLTFPRMAMSPFMQGLSYGFPFSLYTEIFIGQAMRGAPIIYSLRYMGWMSLFIILPLLCLPRLKKISTNEKFWGRI